LRFLSEISDLQEGISPDFLDVPELREASELILESGLTKGELETYDRYWDYISTEKTLKADLYDKGMEQGIERGIEQGIEQEKINSDQKIKEEKLAIAIQAKKMGLSVSDISKLTGLPEQVIEGLE
jgi:predicted transposase/invertase (TIGR01784 family)